MRLVKELTEEQVNNFSVSELERFIISYGDGQGDTYIDTLDELCNEREEGVNPMDIIDEFYREYGGNMVNIAWIEDNKLMNVRFI